MFIDRVRVRVAAGNGGNGCCSFRREKYVPNGGPNGGDGGDGGDMYFVVEQRLTSLLDIHVHSHWRGESGEHGRGSDEHGKGGKDTFVKVPPGTIVRDFEDDALMADLVEPGQKFLAAKGGKGGRGNARFATSLRRVPRFAEKGELGQEIEYTLELKLIAEVGLVGLPNAGKSTLLSAVTAATPKIANYPFTTLTPNLGVASLSGYRTLTIADIPGIIEGAAHGKGLGLEFLRHIERTSVLLFLIDLGDPDPVATCALLESELAQHSPEFAARPKFFALNKADITENRERFEEASARFNGPVFLISGVTGEGLEPLLEALWAKVEAVRNTPPEESAVETKTYLYEAPYEITRTDDGFRVRGKIIERTMQMTDFDNDEAVRYFQSRLERLGINKALKRMGAQAGQSIFIGDFEFEYQPD